MEVRAQTVVVPLWEKLDRMLKYARTEGEHAMQALETLSDSVAEHLAIGVPPFSVGRRSGRRRLNIIFDGERLKPWDPFATCSYQAQPVGGVRKQPLGNPARQSHDGSPIS